VTKENRLWTSPTRFAVHIPRAENSRWPSPPATLLSVAGNSFCEEVPTGRCGLSPCHRGFLVTAITIWLKLLSHQIPLRIRSLVAEVTRFWYDDYSEAHQELFFVRCHIFCAEGSGQEDGSMSGSSDGLAGKRTSWYSAEGFCWDTNHAELVSRDGVMRVRVELVRGCNDGR